MLPCLSVGGGVKLNYPLVPRLPGDVCRGAGALALPPVVGGCCIGIRIRVRVPCTCAATRTRIYTYTRALPPPRRRFQLKSTPGVGPDPVPRSLLSSSTRTVLISPPNRRTCSAMHILHPSPSSPESPSRLFRPLLSPRRIYVVLYALRY